MHTTFNRLFETQVAAHGAKTALKGAGETVTYAELDRRACQVANGLAAAGVAPGDRVTYLGKNTVAYFEFLLGATKARAVTVPINWRLAAPEVDYIVGNARPKFQLVEAPFEGVAAGAGPAVPRRVIAAAPGVGRGDAVAPNDFAAWRDAQPATAREPAADWREPLLQLYTSGTTGRPKGAILTHRSLFDLRAETAVQHEWFRWSADDVSMIAMPVSHVSGTGWGIWTLQHGATGIVAREFDPHAVFEQIVTDRISKMMMVPTAMQIAVRHPRARNTDFSFLKYIYYGGAPLPVSLLHECAQVFRCGFVQMYGMTETSGTIVALAPEDHEGGGARLASVGKALHGVELKIIDAAGQALPTGVTGEIATRSAANMVGYFELPAATAEAMDGDGWLRTGDAGYLDTDGYLYLQDRVKDLIISGGENIYPTEVENAINGHPDVVEVAVIGIPDATWGEAVKAVIVAREGRSLEAADVLAWASSRIARYKLPKTVEFVHSLPRNHTGKVLRRELRDRYRTPRHPEE